MLRVRECWWAVRMLLLMGGIAGAQQAQDGMRMWYRQPAAVWSSALPIGNGRMGAMVFGGANTIANNGDKLGEKENADVLDGTHTRGQDEHLQLNEDTVWAGSRADRLNPRAHDAIVASRRLLLESKGTDVAKITAAEKLANEDMLAIPRRMPSYATLGDLYLKTVGDEAVTGYRRELDLKSGVVRVSYTAGGVHYVREMFAAVAENVIAVRMRADRPGKISVAASMDRPADFAVTARGDRRLVLREGPEHVGAIKFEAEVMAVPQGGAVHAKGKQIVVKGADAVTFYIAAATDFKGGPIAGGDPDVLCEKRLAAALAKGYEHVRDAEIVEHRRLMERAMLRLGAETDLLGDLPTDERLKRVAEGGDDLKLEEIYFQYARYLLLGSSRPGGLPANLQGLWASEIENAWGSKWTINVNTEMNYWLAEPANLSEMHMPLFDLLDMVRTPGTGTGTTVAQKYYDAKGFVIHHNTDVWGDAEMIDQVGSGVWPMGGAWMTLHAWDHYAYTGDVAFLKTRAWPLLEGTAEFFLDSMAEDGKGHLMTGPSVSPENKYLLADGSVHALTMAPTMDIEIVRELFTRTLQACRIVRCDAGFAERVEVAKAKLPEFAVGKLGQLQEWQMDYDEKEPGHRHISHLWALFPGTQITAERPELYKAARVTLERRLEHGGGQTGWSRAWVVNYWDHFGEGDKAYESLQVLFRQSTFPNLMDTHPPDIFQIDGNLGAANGMLEAVIQSTWREDGSEIVFLPALPQKWAEGSITGVRVRGGAEVGLTWAGGRARRATLLAKRDGVLRLVGPLGQRVVGVTVVGKPVAVKMDGKALVLPVKMGRQYEVRFE